ncbi:MAG TPA: DUF4230 domain-containing protein, partial [Gemmatimonadales bacterium]|nr:DUF4230 domain-containing protein [Gemmatimonadales bacterium]
VAIARMEAVAKLVSTETTLRDVVVYRNTRLGSTKRSLVVVTGKALVGIDLARRARVDIDAPARRITITLPHAQLIGLDVTEMKTYDETRGLWNWFKPEDRDTIYLLARQQLMAAAREASILDQAEQNARRLLAALFAPDGYTVDVVFAPFLAPPPPG